MNARFNFTIPDALLDRVKAVAKEKGISSASVINELLRINLGEDTTKMEELERRVTDLENEMREVKEQN